MKKLLVPCDFSKPAISAYRHALDLARQTKGAIELLHVIELPILNDTVLMPVLNFEKELLKELKEKSLARFEKLLTKYSPKNIKVALTVTFGSPSLVITDAITKNKIDLVVMGSHGAAGLREMFIGSNAEKVVRRSTAPVLVVKDYKKLSVKNIVFANSFTDEYADEVVQRVKSLQAQFKAKLHLVKINTLVNFQPDVDTNIEINEFVAKHGFKNFTINIFNAINEERGIIEFAKYIKADLIAIGTHGRKGLAHILHESKAEDVVNHADIPIWTFTIKPAPVEI